MSRSGPRNPERDTVSTLNLHEPGTVRALLDAALSKGWCPDDPPLEEIDGWTLFDAVAAQRAGSSRERQADGPQA